MFQDDSQKQGEGRKVLGGRGLQTLSKNIGAMQAGPEGKLGFRVSVVKPPLSQGADLL